MAYSRFREGVMGGVTSRQLSGRVQIERYGEWERVSRAIDKLPQATRLIVFKAMKDYGKEYLNNLKKNINSNGDGLKTIWGPYSDKYRKFKDTTKSRTPKKYGTDAMYRWSGSLFKALYTESTLTPFSVVVSIAHKPSKSTKGAYDVNQIAHILEKGSIHRSIKPRPLFGPTWTKMGGNRAMAIHMTQYAGVGLSLHFKHA